jgi:hypothetical protein
VARTRGRLDPEPAARSPSARESVPARAALEPVSAKANGSFSIAHVAPKGVGCGRPAISGASAARAALERGFGPLGATEVDRNAEKCTTSGGR